MNIKIYHIIHIDKLPCILNSGGLLSDAQVLAQNLGGTTIGMSGIKQRRFTELTFTTYPDLYVGECVPFYFCPRSVMLYMIHMGNMELDYQGGQDNIIHLEFDLMNVINWANNNTQRWVFTRSNAGSYYFEDTNDINNLSKLDWYTINSDYWSHSIDTKQAEFLCENFVDFSLVEKIVSNNKLMDTQIKNILQQTIYNPIIEINKSWYY